MGFDQYHEPPEELSQETRTFARMIQSMIEEAEAIDWYQQRLDVTLREIRQRTRTRRCRTAARNRWRRRPSRSPNRPSPPGR